MSRRAPGVRRAVEGAMGRTGESASRTPSGTSSSAVPGPGGPPTRFLWRPGDRRSGGSAARPWPPASQARAAPSTGPGTPWGAGSGRLWPAANVATGPGPLPKERPAWGAGAGRGPGSSPPAPVASARAGSGWLRSPKPDRRRERRRLRRPWGCVRRRSPVGTAQGLVAPRFRLQRPGSPRAAPPLAARRRAGPRHSTGPSPPRCPLSRPGATPVPGSAYSRTPGPPALRLLGLSSRCLPRGPTPLGLAGPRRALHPVPARARGAEPPPGFATRARRPLPHL